MPSVRVVVADTGPLIALARVGGLRVLPELFAQTLVTEAVLVEYLARPDRPEGVEIAAALDAGWLTRHPDPILASTLIDEVLRRVGE
jgi:predicted nucleic acid-binding protein